MSIQRIKNKNKRRYEEEQFGTSLYARTKRAKQHSGRAATAAYASGNKWLTENAKAVGNL